MPRHSVAKDQRSWPRYIAIVMIIALTAIASVAVVNYVSDSREMARLSEFGKSPYYEGATRTDLIESGEFTAEGVRVTIIRGGEQVYHPVSSSWFIARMLDSYQVTKENTYLDYARVNLDHLLEGAERTETGTWFPYHFEHAPGGLQNGIPWVSGMAQGMVLSNLSRMYEVTGESKYRDEANDVFRTFTASKDPGEYWFANSTDCEWGDPCLYLEEYPSAADEQNAHVVNGFIYSIWGLYDYMRIFGNREALSLFTDAVATLEKSFDRYRYPGSSSWYAMNEFGYETWKRPANYHVGVTHQLNALADITGSNLLMEQADILESDCASDPCEAQP